MWYSTSPQGEEGISARQGLCAREERKVGRSSWERKHSCRRDEEGGADVAGEGDLDEHRREGDRELSAVGQR